MENNAEKSFLMSNQINRFEQFEENSYVNNANYNLNEDFKEERAKNVS